MKLSELKQIENHLKDFTIDDFYINSKMIRSEIQKLIALESDRTLKAFLHDSAKEMVEKLNSILDSSPLDAKIDESLKKKERLESEITNQKQSLDELDKQFESIPSTESRLKNEIKEIEEEILQIQPLSEKEPYFSRIEELKVKKSDTANKMDNLAENIENQKRNLIGEIKSKESDIQNYEDQIKELEERKQTDQEDFLKLDVLRFLCKMLLREEIEFYKSYRTYYEDEKQFKRGNDENTESYFYRIQKQGADKIDVRFSSVDSSLAFHFFSNTAINTVPKDWRKELSKLLSGSLPFDSGFASIKLDGTAIERNDRAFIKLDGTTGGNIKKHTAIEDETKALILSALLSIKQSLMNNHQSLFTADKSIFLSLTGGVMAEILFREKGKTLKEIKEPVFYVISLNDGITNDITLYSQSGYNATTLKVINGFYVIALDYVIEILFKAAPILFESNQSVRSVTNIDDDDD
ncbi:MAG: hypothetical protein DRQ49_03775 [Gammaproteobacteria bacterium]|nr:MAG: hypothetical protein DRQ41_12100 [Gammaproteobacteria bacterium]RKZ41865.1 MAG: hypothetical protein DRQ49_03775 [Gammaproteobacteria bacterium]